MISTNYENVGGFPAMGGFYNGGGGGILGLIALLSIFRGNLGRGDFDGARGNLSELMEMVSNNRAELGEAKFGIVNSQMQSTMQLMQELCAGRVENLNTIFNQTMHLDSEFQCISKEICQVDKDVLENRAILGNQILTMGFKNEIEGLKNQMQTNAQFAKMQHENDMCCCKTNEHITNQGFTIQLRDLENQNCTNKQLDEIKCMIKDSQKDNRIAFLEDKLNCAKEKEEKEFIHNQIWKAAGKTNCEIDSIGNAFGKYFALTGSTTPFPWNIPNCGNCGW